ncbi:MAG: BatA domain-containing protein [Planctomycetaceae bacterium]
MLAFGFAQPWMLWGLIAAAIPVIIHLFFRRRYQVTPWGAMQFLLAASKKHARRLKWEQWLLLCVRTLAIALLVLAFARPSGQELTTFFPEAIPRQRVLIFDTTLSMGGRTGDMTPFVRAQTIANQIVQSCQPGDACQLVRTAGLPRVLIRQQGFLRDAVTGEIDRLSVVEEPGSWEQVLEEAVGLLDGAPQFQQKEVYLLSDFQQSNWKMSNDNGAELRRNLYQKLTERADVHCIDVGPEPSRVANVSITQCTSTDELATSEQPSRWLVTVKNWGDAPAQAVGVDFFVGGQLVDTKPLQIAAGAEATVEFQHQLIQPGYNVVEARLADDALVADNRRWRVVNYREELPILLINGKASGEKKQQATYFAELALAPSFDGPAVSSKDWIQPHVIRDGELTATDLGRYACIVVCNVATFTEREADILQQYVASGRGLIVTLGDQVQPETYNEILYREGQGILPAKLGNRHGEIGENPTMFAFDPVNYEHPLLKAFAGNPDAGLETSRVSMFYQLESPLPSAVRIALKYETGDPAIVESRRGRGTVLLVTTSVDRQWGTWVLWPSFPPLLNEMVRYVVIGNDNQLHVSVGEPLIWPMFQLGSTNTPITIQRPDNTTETLTPQKQEEPANNTAAKPDDDAGNVDDIPNSLVYEKTDKSGVYELRGATSDGEPIFFAVHPPAAESDLTYLDERTLQKEIFADLPVKYQTDFQQSERSFAAVSSPPAALPKVLLWLVLLCLIAEPVLAWRFQHGVALLLCLLTGGLVIVLWKSAIIGFWTVLLLGMVILGSAAAYLIRMTSMRR